MKPWLACIVLLIGWVVVMDAPAHEIRPALLDITEHEPGWFDVTWKVPARGGRMLGIDARLPDTLVPVGPPSVRDIPGARVQRSTHRGDGQSLIGERIVIDGLAAVQTDVLLHIRLQDGTTHSAVLRPSAPAFTVPARASKLEVAGSYWRMGVIHILEGIDHLLFVLALLLLIGKAWPLFKAVTAFTVAHSITLALATLGVVHVPSSPTEAVIALSIVFLAAEIVHKQQGATGLTERYPWLIAFIFGLFHGLGFAGALSEIGVPQHEVPLALLMFNVGVETGQILFIAAVLGLLWMLWRLAIPAPPGAWRLLPYGIGGMAAFWTIERVVVMNVA